MRLAFVAAAVLMASLPARAQYSGGVVKVGVLTDLSGVYSELGGPGSVKAAEMAAQDFMKKHKDIKVEVLGVDHANKADIASNKAQEMIDRDGVDFIVDVPNSACALAASEVVKQKKKVLFVVTGGSTALTNEKCSKYTFHYAYDNYDLANGTGTAVTKAGGKTWYNIYPNYAFGKDLDAQFRKAVEASGGKNIAPSDATPFPNTDFSTYLLKAKSLKPQVFGTMQAGQDLVNVVKQYNEFGLRQDSIKLAIGLLTEADIRALGQDAFSGAEATVSYFSHRDAKSLEWAKRFHKEFGKWPTYMHAGVFSATTTYLEAVARAKSDDGDKVVAALDGHKFSDFFAEHARIRPEDHRVLLDVYQVQVKLKKDAKDEDDLFTYVGTTPAESAFMPLSESKCKMASASATTPAAPPAAKPPSPASPATPATTPAPGK
jgi:branched-chain amino acid transport system substrate-binding protein